MYDDGILILKIKKNEQTHVENVKILLSYMREPFCCSTLALSFSSSSRPSVVPHSLETTQRNSLLSNAP